MNFQDWIPYMKFSAIYSTLAILLIALSRAKLNGRKEWLIVGYLVYSSLKSIYGYYSMSKGNNLYITHLSPILDSLFLLPALYPGSKRIPIMAVALTVVAGLTELLLAGQGQRYNFLASFLAYGFIVYASLLRVVDYRDNADTNVSNIPFSYVALGVALYYLSALALTPFNEGLLSISQTQFIYVLIVKTSIYWMFFMIPTGICFVKMK